MFGDGVVVHAGGRGDDDLKLVAGLGVDGVEADAGAGQDPQAEEGVQDVAGVGFRAGDDGAAALGFADECVRVPVVECAVDRLDGESGFLEESDVRTFVCG